MQEFPEQRKGLAANLAKAFCNAAEFLSEGDIGGLNAGAVTFFVALAAAFIGLIFFHTAFFVYLVVIGSIAGQIAYFLICKRTCLGGYLLETSMRVAAVGLGWMISNAFLDRNSFLGVLPIVILPFVGEGAHALYRRWYRNA